MIDPTSDTMIGKADRLTQADEENLRLLTSFNDIFVCLAAFLLVGAVTWIGCRMSGLVGYSVGAGTCWLLAEHFTRRCRMALPSILLMLAFVANAVALASWVAQACLPATIQDGFRLLPMLVVGGVAGWVHWRRFQVPVTIAVIVVMATASTLLLTLAACPPLRSHYRLLTFICGIATFVQAMRWDSRDRERTNNSSDVAFWLHMLAAPMIVDPAFQEIGLTPATVFLGDVAAHARHGVVPDQAHFILRSLLGLAVYAVLGAVALVIDRRAGLVAGLTYAIVAMTVLLRSTAAPETEFALTGLLVGGLLLLLSVFWRPARAAVLQVVPEGVRKLVPRP